MTALPLAALDELRDTRVLRIVGGTDVEGVRPARRTPVVSAPATVIPLPVAAPAAASSVTTKAVRAVVGWAFAAALVIGGAAGVASALNPAPAASDAVVTVAAGDSLWSIAETHGAGTNTRDYVAALISVNGLSSATIHEGQALTLPKLP